MKSCQPLYWWWQVYCRSWDVEGDMSATGLQTIAYLLLLAVTAYAAFGWGV